MITRRQCLQRIAASSLALVPGLLRASEPITRAIPATGEALPIIGLGSSASFSRLAGSADPSPLREVLATLIDHGGRVFDTAPGYGQAEAVSGGLVNDLQARERVFWATKLNVAGRGGGRADPEEAWQQIETSFERIGKSPIDLIQVHNLGDVPTQMGILKELKEEGRVRYIGVTCTRESRYPELAQVMRSEPVDFIGVDYAVDNPEAAWEILPMAADRGIAVLVYAPFGRTRLWQRVAGQPVPDWAREFGADSWARFFLKWVAGHPAVTAITPSTSKPAHMLDNLGAAAGELPDEAMRKRMVDWVDALPGG